MKEFLKNILYFVYNLFVGHPRENNESYISHLYIALKISLISLLASLFLIVHSIFPFLFKNAGSFLIHCALDICDRNKNITKERWDLTGDEDDLW